MIGIYCISNLDTGKRYVGKSINIENRFEEHIRELRNNSHFNSYLQHAWNKYGETRFEFTVLEVCSENCINEREKHWINHFGGFTSDMLYNLAEGGEGGKMHPDVVKRRASSISKSRKMTPKGTYSGSNNSMYGKHHSESTKQMLRDKCKHAINPMQGKHHSDEAKLKISKANSGRTRSEITKAKISAGVKKHIAENGVPDKPSKYSEAFKTKLREEYVQGKTFRQIANEYDLSYDVCRLLIKYNRLGVKEGNETSIV